MQRERRSAMKKSKHGMRRGFACIFYGAPGTGKTETVLQLAHRTGRGIMTVDVPNLRSKWVGDTEKNTKAIFERYRNYCKRADLALVWSYDPTNKVLTIGNAGEFTTTGTATAIDNTSFPSGEGRGEASKILRNGTTLILRGDKTYTLQGQEVK